MFRVLEFRQANQTHAFNSTEGNFNYDVKQKLGHLRLQNIFANVG